MESNVPAHPSVDFLSIGHICQDVASGGFVVGGAAAYTAAVAAVLGCRAAIVTSAAREDEWSQELPGIAVHKSESCHSTIFENVYSPAGRTQIVRAVADELSTADVPSPWTRASMVYLGPIANEVDPKLIHMFSNSVVAVGPQGWMRRWDEQGRVYQVEWESAADVLPLAAIAFLSTEDLARPELLEQYRHLTHILVLTDGANGCTVYFQDEVQTFAAPTAPMVDTTGAGDIFAASYLVRFYQTGGDLWEAAEFANRIAAHSVSFSGLPAKMAAIRDLMVTGFSWPHERIG